MRKSYAAVCDPAAQVLAREPLEQSSGDSILGSFTYWLTPDNEPGYFALDLGAFFTFSAVRLVNVANIPHGRDRATKGGSLFYIFTKELIETQQHLG